MPSPQTAPDVRKLVLDIIADITLEENAGELDNLDDETPLRQQLDLDSMDFLDIVMELKKRHRVEVPQEDYPHLASLKSCVEYLTPKLYQ